MRGHPDITSNQKQPRGWVVWLCVIGFLIVVIAVLLFGLSTHLRSQVATIKAAIRAKGEPLTCAELPVDQPGDPAANADLAVVAREIKTLQSVLLNPGIQLVSGPEFDASNRPIMRPAFLEAAPITFDHAITATWDVVSAELHDPAEPLLTRFNDALRRGAYPPRTDFSKGIAAPPSWVADLRGPFILLATSAEAALRAGEINAALEDLQTVLVVIRRELPDESLIPLLVGSRTRTLAWRMAWSILQHPAITATHVQRLIHLLDPPIPPGDIASALATERAMDLDFFAQARAGTVKAPAFDNLNPILSSLVWSPLLSYADEIAYLSIITPQIDALRAPNSRGRLDAFKALPPVKDQLPDPAWAPLTWVALPAIDTFSPRVETTAAMFALAKAAAVIKLFELTQGGLPNSLAEAAAAAQATIPDDPLGSGALNYRPLESGGFLLYSVGANGVDDGGDGHVVPSRSREDVESGADLVWPGLLDAWPVKSASATGWPRW